jgi:Domain of unknown function (DUF222)
MISTREIAQDRVLAELAALGPDLAGLTSRPAPGSIDKLELMTQIREVACFVDRAQGQLARLVGVLDAVSGASEAGYSSAVAFMRHACGRSPARAGELVATGRGLRTLKATGRALMAGKISFDAAHVICRSIVQISDPGMAAAAEEQMLVFARAERVAGGSRDDSSSDEGFPGGTSSDSTSPDCAPHDCGEDGSPGSETGADPEAGPEPGAEPAPGSEPTADSEPAAAGAGGGNPSLGPAGARPWARPGLDPTQLRTVGEDLIHRADPERAEERERKRFERRHLSFGFTVDDIGTITAACGDRLSLEIIKTAVHAFGPPLGGDDTRTAAQRRMDGLTAACQAALDSGTAGGRHGAAPHLSIMVDEQTLARPGAPFDPRTASRPSGPPAGEGEPGRPPPDGTSPADQPGPAPARTGYGTMLTARQVLALACRAEISMIRWRDGIPLNVGRRYRTEPPALRRALEARDQGCRFPGCGMPAPWCTGHHLRAWALGGVTSLANTALFCFVHHMYYLHSRWTVTGDPNGTLQFTHPHGRITLTSPLPAPATQARAA